MKRLPLWTLLLLVASCGEKEKPAAAEGPAKPTTVAERAAELRKQRDSEGKASDVPKEEVEGGREVAAAPKLAHRDQKPGQDQGDALAQGHMREAGLQPGPTNPDPLAPMPPGPTGFVASGEISISPEDQALSDYSKAIDARMVAAVNLAQLRHAATTGQQIVEADMNQLAVQCTLLEKTLVERRDAVSRLGPKVDPEVLSIYTGRDEGNNLIITSLNELQALREEWLVREQTAEDEERIKAIDAKDALGSKMVKEAMDKWAAQLGQ